MKRLLTFAMLLMSWPALAQQGVTITQGGVQAGVTAGGALKIDGSAVTQPVSQIGAPWSVSGSGTFAVTQSTSPWVVSVPTWAGGTLGAMANYGTSPGAVLVPGVNSFITNIPAVSQSGTWNIGTVTTLPSITFASPQAVTQSGIWTVQPGNTANTTPWLSTINQGGNSATVLSSGGLYTNLRDSAGTELGSSFPNAQPLRVDAPSLKDATGSKVDPTYLGGSGSVVSILRGVWQQLGTIYQAINGLRSPFPLVCPYIVAINQTGSTTVVTNPGGKSLHVCSYKLVSATAQNVGLDEGTGTTCATGATHLDGSTSIALAANGGYQTGAGQVITIPMQKPGDNLCVMQSGAGNVSGYINYGTYAASGQQTN